MVRRVRGITWDAGERMRVYRLRYYRTPSGHYAWGLFAVPESVD